MIARDKNSLDVISLQGPEVIKRAARVHRHHWPQNYAAVVAGDLDRYHWAVRAYLAQPRGTEYDRTAPGPRPLLQGVLSMGEDFEKFYCENRKTDAGGDDKP